MVLIVCLLSFVGCKPNEIDATLYSSDIENVIKGEVLEVPVTIAFSLVGKDKENLIDKAVELVKPYLSEGSTFNKSKGQWGDRLVIETKVPMFTPETISKVVGKRLLGFQLIRIGEGSQAVNQVTLVDLNHMSVLDKELKKISYQLGVELPSKTSNIRIVNDLRNDEYFVKSYCTWVAKKPNVFNVRSLKNREEVIFTYKGGSGSVYSQNTIYFMCGIPPK